MHILLKKLEDLSASLIKRLNEQDEVIKLLKEEVKKVENGGTGSTSNKGQRWSSFFDTGLTRHKTTEQDMVLMAIIRSESKQVQIKNLIL